MSDVAWWEDRPGAPSLVPQAPQLQNYGISLPVLVCVKLRSIHTAVLNPRVVGVLKKDKFFSEKTGWEKTHIFL